MFRQDVTAPHGANLNTTAFKVSRVHSLEIVAAGRGAGAKSDAVTRFSSPGSMEFTSRALDIAIAGEGFFKLSEKSGGAVYTRSGNFSVDGDGNIVNENGLKLEPNVQVPSQAKNVTVNNQGQIRAILPGSTEETVVGEIKPVRFSNPAGLEALGGNLFSETANSGSPVEGSVGAGGIELRPSFLEMSNVDLAEQFTQSIINSRSMEANVKAFRVQDRMAGTVLDLVR